MSGAMKRCRDCPGPTIPAKEVLRCAREATAEAAAQREALGEVMLHIPDAMLALAKEHPEQFAGLKAVQQLCDERDALAERLKRVESAAHAVWASSERDFRDAPYQVPENVMDALADVLGIEVLAPGGGDGGR